jgi:hypothetical protein
MARRTEEQKRLLEPRLILLAWISAVGQAVFGVVAASDPTLPVSLRFALLAAVPSGIVTITSYLVHFSVHRREGNRWFGRLGGYLTAFWLVVGVLLTTFHPLITRV